MAAKDVRSRRRTSDAKAWRYLGQYELRRIEGGDFGIFLRGSRSKVGEVSARAAAFVRALGCTLDAMNAPSDDRMLKLLPGVTQPPGRPRVRHTPTPSPPVEPGE